MGKKRTIDMLLRFFKWFVLLLASFGMSLMGEAQKKKDDLQISYEHFWTDYATALKKVKGEKDSQEAARLVDKMKKDILPRLGQLVKSTEEWKKDHTAAEIKEIEEWVSSNPYVTEVENLQSELMIRSAKEGGALGRFFSEYMRAMMAVSKKK